MPKWVSVLLKIGKITAFFCLFGWLLTRSDIKPNDESERVRMFTRQIEFDFSEWMWHALWLKGEQVGLGAVDYIPVADQPQIVIDYITLVEEIHEVEFQIDLLYTDPNIKNPDAESQALRIEQQKLHAQRQNLAPLAESILQNQLSTVLADLGLTLGGQPIPPVMYHVSPLPKALVVSPRDEIRQINNIGISPEITTDQRFELEDRVDQALDVSSLVVNVGGIGLYPTMVMETTDINWMSEVVAHEWVHNFLSLRPLGVSYGSTPELRIINEMVASIADVEIATTLIARYYPEYLPPPPTPQPDAPQPEIEPAEPPPFDFRAEMHETRLTVDDMLAAGEIEAAETYMETRRQLFWDQGYRIRKLNQAYFAFYGAYAAHPGGAAGATEDPIGDAIRTLRAESDSLAAFLNRISWVWSWEQLQNMVTPDNELK